MIKATIKLVSSYRHHGSSGPKPTKVRSTAASKFNAIMNRKQPAATDGSSELGTETGKESNKSKEPKAYGTHQGNLQVAVLKEVEIEDSNKEEVATYVTNITSNFEGRSSWDLRAAKHAYKSFKDEVVKEYAEKYGNQLSERTTTEMLQKLSAKAFRYTSHQIVITIESDSEIEGGRRGENGHYFITIKTKMVYSQGKQLFTANEIDALKNASSDKVVLRVSTITRVPAVLTWDAKNQRYMVTYQGSGSITAQDSYS